MSSNRFPAVKQECNRLRELYESYDEVTNLEKQNLRTIFLNECDIGQFLFNNMSNESETLEILLAQWKRSKDSEALQFLPNVRYIASYNLEMHLHAVTESAIESNIQEIFDDCAYSNTNSYLNTMDEGGWAA